MTAVLDKITTLQIPDTKDLKYDVTDNKILPSLDTHFATLKDLDETVIVDESHRLQKCIERAKDTSDNDLFDLDGNGNERLFI